MGFGWMVRGPFRLINAFQVILSHLRFDPFWYGHDVTI